MTNGLAVPALLEDEIRLPQTEKIIFGGANFQRFNFVF